MAVVSSNVEQLITMYRLGTIKKVYKPHTILSIITGGCLITFACVWIIFTLVITGSFFLLTNQLPFQQVEVTLNSLFTAATSSTSSSILSIIFMLFGLIFVSIGLRIIISAILNQHVRVVLCEYGVAHLGRKSADAFHWEQVATVLDKINVNKNADTRTIRHTYIVVCKDGRRFVFNNVLRKVEQLGEEIQIAVAIYQKSA